jgi:uncharacterized protein YndB with AHSA1/START domain
MSKRVSYTLEYTFKAKAEMLYYYFLTPYNLASWFADEVNVGGETFTFSWENSVEKARLVKQNFKKRVVFQWIDRKETEFLSFVLDTDEITGETDLIITDFDDENQIESAKQIWNASIENLKRLVGG